MPPKILVKTINRANNILSLFEIFDENMISRKTRKTQIKESINAILNSTGA